MLEKFIRQNYFIGICAFAQTIGTFLIFGLLEKSHLFYALAVLFGTKVVYSLLRKDYLLLDAKHWNSLMKTDLLPFLLSIGCLSQADLFHLPIGLLLGSVLICFLYGMHIYGQKAKRFSLRNSGWLKLISIALVWTAVTAIIPLLLMNKPLVRVSLLYSFAQFLMIIFLTLPFDLNDYTREKMLGFITIPQLLGDDMTKKLGRMLAITAWGCMGFVSLPAFLAMGATIIAYLRFLNQDIQQMNTIQLTQYFDGILILNGILCGILVFIL